MIMSKTAPINMRVEPDQRALLTKAAAMLNKDRSTFILDVACNVRYSGVIMVDANIL